MKKEMTAGIVIVIVVVASVALYLSLEAGPPNEVKYLLAWTPNAQFNGIFVAQYLGYFEDEGLDVEVIGGKGGTYSIQMVGVGKADIAMSTAHAALIGRSQGIPVKSVALIHAKNPMCIFSLPESNINTPEDLEGKTVAIAPTSSSYIYFLTMLELKGINKELINEVPKGFDPVTMLSQGQADAVSDYSHWTGYFYAAGYTDVKLMEFEEMGITGYNHIIVASDSYIEKHPDIVRKVVRATLKGWEYAREHPENAVDMMIHYYPELDREAEIEMLMWNLEKYQSWEDPPFGYSEEEGWLTTQSMLVEAGFMTSELDNIHEAYTEEFLP